MKSLSTFITEAKTETPADVKTLANKYNAKIKQSTNMRWEINGGRLDTSMIVVYNMDSSSGPNGFQVIDTGEILLTGGGVNSAVKTIDKVIKK